MGEGGGLKHVTINSLKRDRSSRLCRLWVAAHIPVFGARRLHSRGWEELRVGERGGAGGRVGTRDSQP